MLKAVGEITLTVINDGENGTSPYFISVGNESQNIPCDNNGIVSENMLITIPFGGYSGTKRTTCTVSVNLLPTGITLGSNSPSSTTNDGSIVFNVEKGSDLGGNNVLSGEINLSFDIEGTILNRKFTWTKTKDGDAACLYQLSPSSLIIKKGVDDVLSPSIILFSSTVTVGNNPEKQPYSGRFIIEESTDGSTYKNMYVSSLDESEKNYTPSSSKIKVIRCTLCSSGSITNVLDIQSVIVLTDVDNIDDALSEIKTEISNVSLKVDKNEKAITEEVWRDTLIKVTDSDGNVVERSLENLIVKHNVDLNGVETKVQDVTTKYENDIPTLKEDVSIVKQNQSSFETKVSQVYETKEDAKHSYTTIKEDAKRITLEAADKKYANQSDSVKSVEVLYYLSSSTTQLLDGEWMYPAPEWKNGFYMWSKQKTTLVDGTTSETDPTCIAGATGQKGENGLSGRGVSFIKPQYYSSTSKVSVPKDAVWSCTQPEWKSGNYLWTRNEITYINSDKTTSVEYTDPICDTTWEAVEVAKAALEVNINEVKQEVTDARGSDATLAVRLGKIDSRVSDVEGNITEVIQTATEAKQVAEDAKGNVTEAIQKADELESTVSKKLIGIRYIRDWLNANTSSDVSEKRWSKCKIISDDLNIGENIYPYSYSLNEVPTISNQTSAKSNGIINKSFYTSSNEPTATDYITLNNGTWDALQIDLGTEKKVDYLTIWHYYANICKYNHKLMVSKDNKKWTVLFDSNVAGAYTEDPNGKTYILNDGYSTSGFTSTKQTIDNITTIVSNNSDAIQNFDSIEKSLQDSINDNSENISNIKDSLTDTNSDLSNLKQSYSQTTNTVNSIKDTVASLDDTYAKKSEVELSDNEWKVRLAKIGLYDGDDIEHVETNFTVSEAGAILNNNKGQSVSLELNGESGTGLYGRYNNEIILQVTKDLTITKRLQSENGIDCMTIKLVPSSYGEVGALLHVKSGGTS